MAVNLPTGDRREENERDDAKDPENEGTGTDNFRYARVGK